MKRTLLPLLAVIFLPNTANSEISDKSHKRFLDARDYEGCAKTNKKPSLKNALVLGGYLTSF